MPKPSKYDSYVKPYLGEIEKWTEDFTDEQIAEKLGISRITFINYKKKYPELAEAVTRGRKKLVKILKDTLKKKAKGFYYEETKTTKIRNPDADSDIEWVEKIEITRKYAQPDTGAAHLLLKNLDENWHNDDVQTLEIKRKAVEIQQQKIDQNNW